MTIALGLASTFKERVMSWQDLLTRLPINQTAAVVTSQRRCVEVESDLTREELRQILSRLERKHRLLKHVIGIKNKSQHVNAMWKNNKGFKQYRHNKEPRSFAEYRLIGLQMQQINRELQRIRTQLRNETIELITEQAA